MSNLDTLTVCITGDASALKTTLSTASKSVSDFADDVSTSSSKSTGSAFDNMSNTILNKTSSALTSWGSKITSGMSSLVSKAGNVVTSVAAKAVGTAVDKVMSSVSAGIARSDTMNNFSLVMSNMQIATEDSDAAIQTLSDRLTGLPTSLDTAAGGVERLTSKNRDIEYSTDLWLALNDALLAGGTSSDQQARAMEQLMQVYSKGSIDLMEWTTLQTAIPGQLSQIADAYGMTTDELYAALKSGEISVDQFMDKIVEMDTTSTDCFTSFQEQAFNATGGIQTSMDLIDTAIERGIANIIDALGRSEITDFLGHIKDSINDLAEKIVDFINECADTGALEMFWDVLTKVWDVSWKLLDVIGQFILKLFGIEDSANTAFGVLEAVDQALDWVSDALDWLTENLDWLIPVIESAIGMFMGMYAALELISIISTVGSGPLGLIIMLIGLIVGALAGWIASDQDLQENILNVFSAIGDFVGSVLDGILWFFTEAIPGAWNNFVETVQWLWDCICEFFGKIGEFISDVVGGIVGFFTETIPNAFNDFVDFFASIPEKISEFLSNIWDKICETFWGIVDFIGGLGEDIWNAITEAFSGMIEFITSLPEKAIEWGKDMIQGFIDGILNMISSIGDAIGNIGSTIASFLGFSLPDQGPLAEADTFMPDMMNLLAEGIEEGSPELEEAAGHAASAMTNAMMQAFQQVLVTTQDVFRAIVQIISEALTEAAINSNDIVCMMADALTNAFTTMADNVGDAISYMCSVLTSGLRAALEVFGEFGDTASSWGASLAASFGDMGNALSSSIAEPVAAIVNNVIAAVSAMADALIEILTSMSETMLQVFQQLLAATQDVFNSMAQVIGSGLNSAAVTANDTVNSMAAALIDSFMSMADGVGSAIAYMCNVLTDGLRAATAAFNEFGSASGNWGVDLANSFTDVGNALSRAITKPIMQMSDDVLQIVNNMAKALVSTLTAAVQASGEVFGDMAQEATNVFVNLVNQIAGFLQALNRLMQDFNVSVRDWGRDLVANLISGIMDMVEQLTTVVRDVASVVADFLGFTEPNVGPLAKFHTFMPDMMELMAKGIRQGVPLIEGAANYAADVLAGALYPEELLSSFSTNDLAYAGANVTINNYYTVDDVTLQGADEEDARTFFTRILDLAEA